MQVVKIILCCISFLALTSNAWADEYITVSGWGSYECGEFVAWRASSSKKFTAEATVVWVQGFINGVNQTRLDREDTKNLEIPTPETIGVMTENYCKQNPLDKIYKAARNISGELITKTQR